MNDLRISETDAILEAKHILQEIIQRVNPEAVVCEGISTLKKFEDFYCSRVERAIDGECVDTPNGKYRAKIYRADLGVLDCTNRKVKLLGIGHPSKYCRRREWGSVVDLAKSFLSAQKGPL